MRPWIAADGALIRLRLTGGVLSATSLRAISEVSRTYGDGDLHLTKRANLQLRALPHQVGRVPAEVVDAIAATGLLPVPSHELVRNIMISPFTGRLGGLLDVRPLAHALDRLLCADPELATLPGRFLFVLDDGRGDQAGRSLDLGLMAVDAETVQIRIGSHLWGPVVPASASPEALLELARRFLVARGGEPSAPWHIDELADHGARRISRQHARDLRTHVTSLPTPYGIIGQNDGRVARHIAVPAGVLTPALCTDVLRLAGQEIIVTPWRSIIVPDLERA